MADSAVELLFYGLYLIFVLPGASAMEAYQQGKFLQAIGWGILALLIIGGLIFLVYALFKISRTCPKGQELYIVQRDIFNIVTPEYSVYKNKAPVGNYEVESYPPVIRVDTPTTDITKAFFPQFEFSEPKFASEYSKGGYRPLIFRHIPGLKSLIYPSYDVYDSEEALEREEPIGRMVYPTDEEEATLLGLFGLEKRYVIEFMDKTYVTTEQFVQFKLVKEMYFFDADDPKETPIAVIKPREQASGRSGVYTVCLGKKLSPEVKEFLFATVIALDQHVFKEEK